MAIRNDLTRRAMRTFLLIVLIARVVKSEPTSTCSYYFNATHAIISCTSWMYTKANCAWTYEREPLNGRPPTYSESRSGANRYYSTACSTSLKIESPGLHKVLLEFVPNQDINNATISQEIDIVVVTPTLAIARGDNHEAIESSIMVQQNRKVRLICTATGGNPQVRDLTFECQNERTNTNRMTEYSQTARIFITATVNMDAKQCNCTAKQLSIYEGITKSVTINRAKIPDQPKLSVSNGRITNGFLRITDNEYVVLTCSSAGGKPTNTYMTLECSTDPPYRKTVNNIDTVRLGVTIQKKMDFKKCICSAKHITTQILTTYVTLDVLVPPKLSMYNAGTGVEMNSTINVEDKQTLALECQSNGGRPATSKMILTCPSDDVTRHRTELDDTDHVLLSVVFKSDMNDKYCSCSVQHPSRISSINKDLRILIVVPPKLSMYNADTGVEMNSTIIVKDKQTLTLECQSNGGRPATSKMILTCPSDGATRHHVEQDYTDHVRMSVVFKSNMNDTFCSCSVQHPSRNSSINKDLRILIVETPNNPVIHANKGLIIDSKLIVKEDENVYIKCESLGGQPKESHMTIACPYKGLSRDSDTIGRNIYFTRNTNGQQCNCSAKHISSHESLITFLTITVVVVPQSPSCATEIDDKTAFITCTTRKVYPQADCQFKSFDGFRTSMLQMVEAPRHFTFNSPWHDSVAYYNTTCKTKVAIQHRSNVIITISMFPDLQLRNELGKYYNFTEVSRNFNFKVDSAKIQSFIVNTRNLNDIQYVNAKSETTLTCIAFGVPLPTIVISYINSTKQENTTLSRGKAYKLSHTLYPTCSDTGLYRCSVSNMLNVQEETRELILKVTCPAEYYLTADTLPSFGIPVNEDFNITLSVRVYPEPTDFSLFQGSSPIKQPTKILFTYTNENFSLGEISIVAMRLQNKTGLGVYSLRVWDPQESTLNFNLTAEGHPRCPTDFIIETISTNAMTISFRPGFNGGSEQTFSVFAHDPANNITNNFQVEQTSNDVMEYNVTGLTEGTLYILSVETENRIGKPQCPHVNINGTTSAGSKQSPSEMYSLIIFIGLTAALIIISAVACGLLCNKRVALKRCCTSQSSHNDLYDTPETRETHSEDYYLQPVHSVEQVQDISPNEYDMVIDDYEDALS